MQRAHASECPAPYLVALTLILMLMSARVAQSQSSGNDWNAFVSLRHSEERDRVRSDEAFPNRISNGASAGITFRTRTERSMLGLFGRIGGNIYDDEVFEDQITYGGGFSWTYRASSRSSMSLTQTVSKNLRLDTLSELGVVANDFDATSASTRWSFQRQSGPRTSWSAGLGYQFTELTSQVPIQPSQLVLEEQPFGDQIAVPIVDTSVPDEVDLPNGEDEVLRILATEGLEDRSARSQTASASFGLNHSIGQYTTVGFGLNGGYRTIDTSSASDGPAAQFQAFLQRALTTSSAASVGYTYQRSFVIDPNTTIQTLFGGWSYSNDDSTLTATLFGGASRFDAEGSPGTTRPVANASLAGNLTSSTTATISYRRQFSMPLGFGRSLLMDYAYAGVNQSFGTRVTATALAGASLGRDPLVEDSRIDTFRAGGSLAVRLVGGLRLGSSFYYVENEQRGVGFGFDDRYKTLSIFVTYGMDF